MNEQEKARLRAGLGATRVVDLQTRAVRGPLDLLTLREEVTRRLRSSGGRPTDQSWTVTRQVPFKEESWTTLRTLADRVGTSGRRVAAAHVAALLIEAGLDEFEDEEWRRVLELTRRDVLLPQPQAAERALVTYNQFDDWVQRGWVLPATREKRQLRFGADEVMRAHWLRSASQVATIEEVADEIRTQDVGHRYLAVNVADDVTAISATRSELWRLLEGRGTHVVIDQLPERRRLLGLPPTPEVSDEIESRPRAV